MGDRVKERDRKGWKERGINYQSSSGRRDSPIKPYLSGIYNYIMMHPLPHQVNWQSLFLALAVTPIFSLSSLCISPSFFPHILFSHRSILPAISPSCLQREKWRGWFEDDEDPQKRLQILGEEDEDVLLSSHSLQPQLSTCPWARQWGPGCGRDQKWYAVQTRKQGEIMELSNWVIECMAVPL